MILVVGVLCCALAAALWAGPAPAGAAGGGEQAHAAKPKGKDGKGKKGKGKGGERNAIGQLKRAGCPAYHVVEKGKYTAKVRRAARRWKFRVFHFKARLKPPINWERNPYESRSYRQELHGFSWLDTLFNAYKRTGDEGILRQARDIALDWVKSNPRRFRPGRKGFAWHAKAAADRAGYLGFLTRTAGCKGVLNRKQARLLLRSLNSHGKYLANAQYHQVSNFGLFQDLGLLLLAEYLPFEKEAKRWRRVAVGRFPETLHGRLSGEGVWLEHSTQYQFLAIRLLRDFIKYKPGKERDPALRKVLAAMRGVTGWFVAPDGKYALLGDTQLGEAPEWGYNPRGTYQGLKPFDDSGFAFVRQGDSYLAATGGFFNTTHKRADELSFDLFDRGLRIVNEPGNYGYDREEAFRIYQLASQSHSVLAVDGQSFQLDPSATYGSGIAATGEGDGWFAIEGANPLLVRQGVAHSRLFLYKPGQTLVVIDRVRANKPHTYHRFFQLGSQIEIQDRGPGELGLSGPGFAGALHDEAAEDGAAGRALVRGRTTPLQGFFFPGFRKAVPRWSVEYVSQAANADYITTFTLNGPTQSGNVTVSNDNLTQFALTKPDGSGQSISVTRNGDSLSINASSCSGLCVP
jgi:hypothetical protein